MPFATDADGVGYWYYAIYDGWSLDTDDGYTGGVGEVYVYSYHDGESGLSDIPYSYASFGFASGQRGLGSEGDSLTFGTGVGTSFGYGYFEADVPKSDIAYYYFAYNTDSGDYYLGVVFDGGLYGYAEGDTFVYYESDENIAGYWYYYINDSEDPGDAYFMSGLNFVTYYYDGESGLSDALMSYSYGAASGANGIGSEAGYVDFGTGQYDLFGQGYFEADVQYVSAYYYYAVNTESGDVYYGTVYDNGTYG